jgi:glycosyltransferase involved in cell wall biosynthesis
MRVTILWSYWSGSMDACARALVEEHNCSLTIVYLQHGKGAPYSEREFFSYPCKKVPFDLSQEALPASVTNELPDVLIINSWDVPSYKRFAASASGRSLRVLCMDNQWRGTLRQHLGVLVASYYVRPYYETVFLPGKRQAEFARRLGFKPEEIYEGHYSCDFAHFSAQYRKRQERQLSHTFMFVGRLVKDKGIATLLDAWEMFTSRGNKDWRLKIVGNGDYSRPNGFPANVEKMEFVQPSALPTCLLDGDVFVSASNFEPWGMVIHEAAATGMSIICTDACGSGDSYVRNGQNGFVVQRGNASELLSAFEKIVVLSDDTIRKMGAESHALASLRTPSTWANVIIAMMERHELSS